MHAASLPGRRRRREDLPEAAAQGGARSGSRRRRSGSRPAGPLTSCASPRSRPSPGRCRCRRSSSIRGTPGARRGRDARRAQDRPRPAAGDRLRRREDGSRPSSARCSASSAGRGGRRRRATAGIHVYVRIEPQLRFPGGTPGGAGVRARGGAPAARAGDDRVVEGGARREGLHRLQPERQGSNHRGGVLRPRVRARSGVGAGDVGRASGRGDGGLHDRDDACAVRRARRPSRRHRRCSRRHRPLLEWAERDERTAAWGKRPSRRTTRRWRGSRNAVQPSRARPE